MGYKPKFCCECKEKIERKSWRPWTSPRFCELCATDLGISDQLRFAALILLSITTVVGFGSMLRKPPANLVISSNQSSDSYSNNEKQAVSTTGRNANSDKNGAHNLVSEKQTAVSELPKQQVASANRKETTTEPERQLKINQTEPVYYCGALTKKGSPCTRRVKKAGRCWQHAKQPTISNEQKLSADG